MATSYYSYTMNDSGWVDASNRSWVSGIKVNDYNGWDAPTNQEY